MSIINGCTCPVSNDWHLSLLNSHECRALVNLSSHIPAIVSGKFSSGTKNSNQTNEHVGEKPPREKKMIKTNSPRFVRRYSCTQCMWQNGPMF